MTSQGKEITDRLVNNIFGSAIYKGLDVLFNFILVRVAFDFFGAEDYGIWLTILSVFTWFSVIEFGISSSFRKRLTEYFADQKWIAIRTWVSAGYKATGIIYGLTILIFSIILFLIDEQSLPFDQQLRAVFIGCFALYMVHYVFFFLQTVLLATHHTRFIYLIAAVQKMVLVIGILCFSFFDWSPSLILICVWFSVVPLVVWALAHFVAYRTILKAVKPVYSKITSEKIRPLKHLNRAFFLIQLCTLSIYATDNLIIMDRLAGEDVTNFGIAFKYFNILIILFNLVLVPYWSSFTEAAHRNDKQWIIANIRKLIFFWGGLVLLALIMWWLAPITYELWIGKSVSIESQLSLFMAISVLLTAWTTIFSYFLNSISKTNVQLYLLLFMAIINIPLSYYLIDQNGLTGVIMATCLVLVPLSIGLPLQYRAAIKKMKQ